jgi:hypothetical protein
MPMREIASIHFPKVVGRVRDFLMFCAKHRLKPGPLSCKPGSLEM